MESELFVEEEIEVIFILCRTLGRELLPVNQEGQLRYAQRWSESELTEAEYELFRSGPALIAFLKSKLSEGVRLGGHALAKRWLRLAMQREALLASGKECFEHGEGINTVQDQIVFTSGYKSNHSRVNRYSRNN
jgi:hypothetical protein